MEHISYSPRGVCSRHIDIDVENDVIRSVTFTGGCSGNTQGVFPASVAVQRPPPAPIRWLKRFAITWKKKMQADRLPK